jgi:hypothetical protein
MEKRGEKEEIPLCGVWDWLVVWDAAPNPKSSHLPAYAFSSLAWVHH